MSHTAWLFIRGEVDRLMGSGLTFLGIKQVCLSPITPFKSTDVSRGRGEVGGCYLKFIPSTSTKKKLNLYELPGSAFISEW